MFKLKTKLLTILALLTLIFSSALSPLAHAATQNPVNAGVGENTSKSKICEGAGLIIGTNDCKTDGGPTVDKVIRTAINFFSIIVGLISVVMIIISGVKFVTSGGSTEKVASAKNTIIYAVIGLIIVAFAQIIVQFVLSKASKAT